MRFAYRRAVRATSRPHRALATPRIRLPFCVDFPLYTEAKVLDRLVLAGRDARPEAFDWHALGAWQPLRIQLHYFDYLNEPQRTVEWKRAIVADWIESNPAPKGDGWLAYAVSLRVANWVKFFLRQSPDDVDARAAASLYEQTLWLENNLELHILANHYLKNAKALLFAGWFFEGADAERWRRRGLQIFLEQCKEQFLPDGGHYERSPMYHAISLEDVLDVLRYVGSGANPAGAETLETLRSQAMAALDFYAAILMPDDSLPLFNDAARGVGPSPAEIFAYAQATLGYERPQRAAALSLRSLAASGYYVIREASSMLVVDCGPPGPEYQPGHAHCDCLSYVLAIAGEPLVVDTGVYAYENDAARRYARSTAAHNTVQIASYEQSEMWGVFRVGRRACPILPELSLTGPGEAAFVGAHDGYQRSPAKAIHRRSIRYGDGEWFFEDRVAGRGTHVVTSRVHLRPGLVVTGGDGADGGRAPVQIALPDGRPLATLRPAENAGARLEAAPYYPSFGVSVEGHVVVMSCEAKLPLTMSYAITAATRGP